MSKSMEILYFIDFKDFLSLDELFGTYFCHYSSVCNSYHKLMCCGKGCFVFLSVTESFAFFSSKVTCSSI